MRLSERQQSCASEIGFESAKVSCWMLYLSHEPPFFCLSVNVSRVVPSGECSVALAVLLPRQSSPPVKITNLIELNLVRGGVGARSSIRFAVGLPRPVARSYPATALK